LDICLEGNDDNLPSYPVMKKKKIRRGLGQKKQLFEVNGILCVCAKFKIG